MEIPFFLGLVAILLAFAVVRLCGPALPAGSSGSRATGSDPPTWTAPDGTAALDAYLTMKRQKASACSGQLAEARLRLAARHADLLARQPGHAEALARERASAWKQVVALADAKYGRDVVDDALVQLNLLGEANR